MNGLLPLGFSLDMYNSRAYAECFVCKRQIAPT